MTPNRYSTAAVATSLFMGIATGGLTACGGKASDTSPSSRPSSAATTSSAVSAPAPSASVAAPNVHTPPAQSAPKGTLGGKPFEPTVVMMLQSSDGVQLGFYQLNKVRERWKCEEPLGDTLAKLEVSANVDWVVGAPIDTPLSDWSVGDGSKTIEGTTRVTVTKRDEKAFTFSGTVDVKSADGSVAFSGPFEGEFCPTQFVKRDKPDPLAGAAWTDQAFDAKKIPTSGVESIFAGAPSPIRTVVIRSVRGRSGPEEELLFYPDKIADPCMPREDGGWLTSFGKDGKIASREGAKVRADYFAIYLAKPPAKGDTVVGVNASNGKPEVDAIHSAAMHVFEPDAYRSGVYDQYFSAAFAFDESDDTHTTGRVYLALPDKGKSMLVGAFDAKRCPAEKD